MRLSIALFASLIFADFGLADETQMPEVSLQEMVRAWVENQADYDERFADTQVQISGIFRAAYRTEIQQDVGGNRGDTYYVVNLQSDDNDESVRVETHFVVSAKYRSQIAKFKRGDTVTLRGKCREPESPNGKSYRLIFNDCEPVEK